MKTCFKCGQTKPLDQYYAHPRMTDGHLGKCKACAKKDARERCGRMTEDPAWIESEKTRHREKYRRLGYREKHKPPAQRRSAEMSRYRNKYPEKYAARIAAQRLKREVGTHLHHWSYRMENVKDVIAIPIKDHYTLHRFLRYEPEPMCYRSVEGCLLDTKEKHESYIMFALQTQPEHLKIVSFKNPKPMNYSLSDCIAELEAEIGMRKFVYAAKVNGGKMKQAQMDRKIGIIQQIRRDYEIRLKGGDAENTVADISEKQMPLF